MTASLRRWIALVPATLAAGAAVAEEAPRTIHAAAAQPPWLLLAAIAVGGTLLVGGAAVLWARMLEKLAPALGRSTTARTR